MKRVISIVMALSVLIGVAQENQGIKLKFDQSKISPQFTMPELPAITPATNIKPTFNANLPTATDLHLDFNTDRLSDSLAIYQQDWNGYRQTPLPRFSYDTNPYSRDWSSGGVIARIGGGYLTGAGSHTTFLGMGNIANATVAFTMPMGERFQVTAGLSGSIRLNDRLSLNAFGQYYFNQKFHSVAVMPFLGSSSYGGTLGWRASDNFSLDVGARRIYDPYTGRWLTMPIVQPTINLFGAPISFDAGPLLYQLLDGLFGNGKKSRDWGDPRYRPVIAPGAINNQPGFNPNSPVSIPDALRR